jgi:hypothetical protein
MTSDGIGTIAGPDRCSQQVAVLIGEMNGFNLGIKTSGFAPWSKRYVMNGRKNGMNGQPPEFHEAREV